MPPSIPWPSLSVLLSLGDQNAGEGGRGAADACEAEGDHAVGYIDGKPAGDGGLAAAGGDDVEVGQHRLALGGHVEDPLAGGGENRVGEEELHRVVPVGDRQVVRKAGAGATVVEDDSVLGAGDGVLRVGGGAAGEVLVGRPDIAVVIGIGRGATGVDQEDRGCG